MSAIGAFPSGLGDSPAQHGTLFERLRKQTERRAYVMALHLTRSPHDAADLVQDTYLKAWRHFGTYMPSSPFLNWLLRIMTRTYLDNRRRSNPVRSAESINAMVSPSDGEIHEIHLPDPSEPADAGLIRSEFVVAVRQAMAELPEAYRQAIALCDLEGLSYAEIAVRQGTTIGTVRSRIHRGRRQLRDVLEARGIGLESLA